MLLRRQLFAFFLLLCFVRVLLPEASILALHPHQHTQEPAPQEAPGHVRGKALASKQHKHCHEEQLFNVPFQPSAPLQFVAPRPRSVVGILRPFAASVWAEATAAQRCLRGPPAGRIG